MGGQIKFHFLDVGDGDCTLIEFPSGRFGVVDIHTNHNYTDVISYLKNVMGTNRNIFRFVLTHPHQDHLHGLKDLIDAGFSITNFWHTKHDFNPDKETEAWEEYAPHWRTYMSFKEGDQIKYFEQGEQAKYLDEDGIFVLSPSPELNKQEQEIADENGVSIHRNNYILKIKYGKFSAILSGDSDIPCWKHLLETIPEELSANLWKAPHHGTENYYDEDVAKSVSPKVIVLSAGDEYNENSAHYDYKEHTKFTFNTGRHGNVVITAHEDGRIRYSCECNESDFE